MRVSKREMEEEDDEDETPLFARMNKKVKKEESDDSYKPAKVRLVNTQLDVFIK